MNIISNYAPSEVVTIDHGDYPSEVVTIDHGDPQ